MINALLCCITLVGFTFPAIACTGPSPFWPNVPELADEIIPGEVLPRVAIISQPTDAGVGAGCEGPGSISIYLESGYLNIRPGIFVGLLIELLSGAPPPYLRQFFNKVVTLHQNTLHMRLVARHGFTVEPIDVEIVLSAVDIEGRRSRPSKPIKLLHPGGMTRSVQFFNSKKDKFDNGVAVVSAVEDLSRYLIASRIKTENSVGSAVDLLDQLRLDSALLVERQDRIRNLDETLKEAIKKHYQVENTDAPVSLISRSYGKLSSIILKAQSTWFFAELLHKVPGVSAVDKILNKSKSVLFYDSSPDDYSYDLETAVKLTKEEFL